MVVVEDLKKAYRDGDSQVHVLNGLSLEVEDGGFLALLGRSGSGKSTLLNCIAGIEPADSGSIRLGGQEVVGMSDDRRTILRRDRIGFVFQFFNLLPTLSVRENIALPALLQGRPRAEVLRRADRLLEELELGGRGDERPDRLSGGEQQRVATARALINDPVILLADEPTGNLDAQTALATLQLLRDVNERHGVTILMATHSREAARAARSTATLEAGAVVRVANVAAQPAPEDSPPIETGKTPPAAAGAVGLADEDMPVAEDESIEEVETAIERLEEEASGPVAPPQPEPEEPVISAEDLATLQAEAAAAETVENRPLDLDPDAGELEADDQMLKSDPPPSDADATVEEKPEV